MSRIKIGRIIKANVLVSNYTLAHYKSDVNICNKSKAINKLNRAFKTDEPCAAVVSNLTYVIVNKICHYVCFVVDLFNREIIGYSAGPNKDVLLVYRAFVRVKSRLYDIILFHTVKNSFCR